MLYILAFFIPPLGVLFAGRIITAIFLVVVWIALVLFLSIIFGHIIAVIIAWVIIGTAKGDRRHKELLRAASRDKP